MVQEKKDKASLTPHLSVLRKAYCDASYEKSTHLDMDIILGELTPSGMFGSSEASLCQVMPCDTGDRIRQLPFPDAPLLCYPEHAEHEFWQELLEMHSLCLDCGYNDLTLRHFYSDSIVFCHTPMEVLQKNIF